MTTKHTVQIPSNDWVELTDTNATTFSVQCQGGPVWLRGTDGTKPGANDVGGLLVPKDGALSNEFISSWFREGNEVRVFAKAIKTMSKVFFSHD